MNEASGTLKEAIDKGRDAVARARNIMAVTGAGVSAESGIATFRDKDGLWQKSDPEEYATPEAYARDPVKVWRWYDARRTGMAKAEPNPAHRALAELERQGKRVFIVTQNVDDLHEQAGSSEVVHIHGSIWHVRCERDGSVEENRETPLSEIPPRCACGNEMRPAVVWFGEQLPAAPVRQVQHHLLDVETDVCLVVGTEASFGYILQWVHAARQHGATVITVNPRSTPLDGLSDLALQGRAGNILPQLVSD